MAHAHPLLPLILLSCSCAGMNTAITLLDNQDGDTRMDCHFPNTRRMRHLTVPLAALLLLSPLPSQAQTPFPNKVIN